MRQYPPAASLLLALLGWLCACATPPQGPPLPKLRFGVDQADEEGAVRASFERAGYVMVERVEGEHFVAMGFADADGQSRGVRVVTARGIGLSLDSHPATAFDMERRFLLLSAPQRQSSGVGPGEAGSKSLERFFVEERRPADDVRCVRLYLVSPGGLVTRAGGEGAGQKGEESEEGEGPCLSASEAGGEGRLILISDVTLDGLPLPVVPVVPVVLTADATGALTRDVGEVEREAHYVPLLSRLKQALADAHAAKTAMEVYRRAVEAAFVMSLMGQGPEAQKSHLAAAFAGLPEGLREATWEAAIMARVDEGW